MIQPRPVAKSHSRNRAAARAASSCALALLLGILFGHMPAASAQTSDAPAAAPKEQGRGAARPLLKSERLENLFTALRSAPSAPDAHLVEQAIWAEWLDSGSPTVDLFMKRGIEALEAKDYQKAALMFSTITDQAPDYAEGWNKRATLRYLIGDLQGSKADIEKVLRIEPRHFGALAGLALVSEALNDEASALRAWQRVLAVNPQLQGARDRVKELELKVRGRGI